MLLTIDLKLLNLCYIFLSHQIKFIKFKNLNGTRVYFGILGFYNAKFLILELKVFFLYIKNAELIQKYISWKVGSR